MKIETYLNAYGLNQYNMGSVQFYSADVRHHRQRDAFRAKILRVVDELREYETLHHIRAGEFESVNLTQEEFDNIYNEDYFDAIEKG